MPAVAPRYGGPSQVIAPMCGALRDAGADVMLLATDADGRDRLDVSLGETTDWHGVPAVFFHREFSEAFKYSLGLSRWVRRHAREFDLVHVHAVLSHAPLAAAAACRRAGVPCIVRPLGTIASWSLTRKAWRKKLLLSLGARSMLAGAAAIHCTSEEERADIESAFGLRTGVVVPLGVDAESLRPTTDDFDARHAVRYVLALSRLDPKKNFELLIDAFAEAARSGTAAWQLVIAGSGEPAYQQALERRARESGAPIRFAGWVTGAEKRALLARASVFALPSKHENFGIAVLEALAAGVPAIVSRDVQLSAALRDADGGWIVDGSTGSLADALRDALAPDADLDGKSRRAQALAERFAWPAVAARMMTMYRDVLARHGRTAAAAVAIPAGRT
jgi:glycosyltransferase involved in cell wall biosynthesis